MQRITDLRKRAAAGDESLDPDAFKTLRELCNKYGFLTNEYQVVTEDGYILGLYRIPGMIGESLEDQEKRIPILLQHGLEADMMQWTDNDVDKAPAYILARQGYDVWLGNNRGNRFSQGHKTLNYLKDREYWRFTWEEMGTKDMPAMLDFITTIRGVDKISYIGHSQGTTQIMSAASLIPDYYKSKLNVAVLLAPPASLHYSTNSALRFLS